MSEQEPVDALEEANDRLIALGNTLINQININTNVAAENMKLKRQVATLAAKLKEFEDNDTE